MSNLPTLGEAGNNIKSFWERKEGTTGMIVICGAAAAGLLVLNSMLPGIINFFGMAITAIGQVTTIALSALALWVASLVVFNPGFQSLVKGVFKSSMRALTGIFVEIDPIGIMRNYIDDLKKKKREMDEQKSNLNGQLKTIDELIKSQERGAQAAMEMARSAAQHGKTTAAQVNARDAGRKKEFYGELKTMHAKISMIYTVISKYSEACDGIILDITNDVTQRELKRKTMNAAYSAIGKAMKIMKGGDDKELYDQATEFVLNDYGQKLGEIEDFMSSTQTIMDNIDIKNGVWEEKANLALADWEKSTSNLLGGQKQVILEQASQSFPLNPQVVTGVDVTDDYSQFLKKK